MSQAPALPAQTPGMFVGSGGSAAEMTGECAAAVADTGLSEVDFGPFEEVVEVIEAASERTRNYDEAHWLREVEREFEFARTQRAAATVEPAPLRRPTLRERHLALCVCAPLVPSVLFQTRSGDPRTNWSPEAAGYDLRRAPSAPAYVGPTMRTAIHSAVSVLTPTLVERSRGGQLWPRGAGRRVSSEGIRELRAQRVHIVLMDAGNEDQPCLRSSNLTGSLRPRQAESERRLLEQVRPDPPTLARAVSFTATGASARPDAQSSGDDADSERERAQGCVQSNADARERAMQEEVRHRFTEGFVQAAAEAESAEMDATRSFRQLLRTCEREHGGAPPDGITTLAEARREAVRRRTIREFAASAAQRQLATLALGGLDGQRRQALVLSARTPGDTSALAGRMPSSRTPAPQRVTARMVVGGEK